MEDGDPNELETAYKERLKEIHNLKTDLKKEQTKNAELTAKNKTLVDDNRNLDEQLRQAVLFRDGVTWPNAIQYILKIAPWNFIKVTFDGQPQFNEVVKVEIKPMSYTFRQGDLGLEVEEHEFTDKRVHK